jgi:anti-anti-sigma factor
MSRRHRALGLADYSATERRNEMLASSFGSDHGAGAIHVVPEMDEILAVCLEGEFDVANVSALRDQVGSALASGNDLIIDLSQATFIDSSVIHVLFEAGRTVEDTSQQVILQLGTAPIVERALEIVDVERALPRARDREEAARMLRRD